MEPNTDAGPEGRILEKGSTTASQASQHAVDARGAAGVQVGEGNTQFIYTYSRLSAGDQIPTVPPSMSVSGSLPSPYRGLHAFGERDAVFFFGRESAATVVLERMSSHIDGSGLLVVSGVSGSGKSSLLQAGVLPRLRGTGLGMAPDAATWPCVSFSPGAAPLDELALAVAPAAGVDAADVRRGLDADSSQFALTVQQAARRASQWVAAPGRRQPRVLLFIDQFEELFTQCHDEDERRGFLTALDAITTPGREGAPAALIVLGLRADFEARCAAYPILTEAIQDRYLVTAMTDRQLRMAITEPAKKVAARVDDDLVEALLDEIKSHQSSRQATFDTSLDVYGAGVLPLLSHGLDQAWRIRAEPTRLTLADYERTGGIERAVADSAQRAYDTLNATQEVVAQRIFVQLTSTTAEGVTTANRVDREDLKLGETTSRDVDAVLEAFVRERLLTLGTNSVQIAHEVLLTSWPLLRDTWLAETQADRVMRSRIRNATAEWVRHERDSAYLFSGSLLEQASDTAARIDATPLRHPRMRPDERAFLEESVLARRRATRRFQYTIAVITTLALLVISAGIIVNVSNQRHKIQQAAAEAEQAAANKFIQSQQLADRSSDLLRTNPRLAAVTALAAHQINPTPQTTRAMDTAISYNPNGAKVGKIPVSNHDDVEFTRTTAWAATKEGITPYSLETFKPLTKPTPTYDDQGNREVQHVALSRNGNRLIAIGSMIVSVYAIDRLQRLSHLSSTTAVATDPDDGMASISPDGKRLLLVDQSGHLWLWDYAKKKQPTRFPIGLTLSNLDGRSDFVAEVADEKYSKRWSVLITVGRQRGHERHVQQLLRLFPDEPRLVRIASQQSASRQKALPFSDVASSGKGPVIALDQGGSGLKRLKAGKWQHFPKLTQNYIESVAVSGRHEIAVSHDSHISLVNVDTGKIYTLYRGAARRSYYKLVYIDTHRLAAMDFSAGEIVLLDTAMPKNIRMPVSPFAVSPSGASVATAKPAARIEVDRRSAFQPDTPITPVVKKYLAQLPARKAGVDYRFVPVDVVVSDRHVATAGQMYNPKKRYDIDDRYDLVVAWDISGRVIVHDECDDPNYGNMSRAVVTPDEDLLIVSQGAMLCQWKLPSGERLADIDVDRQRNVENEYSSPTIAELSVGHGQVLILASNQDDERAVFVVNSGGNKYRQIAGSFRDAAISPDGKTILLVNRSGLVSLAETSSFKTSGTINAAGTPYKVAWSPNGSHIGIWSDENTLQILDISTGLQTLPTISDSRDILLDDFLGGKLTWLSDRTLMLEAYEIIDLSRTPGWKQRICNLSPSLDASVWRDEISATIPYQKPCA